MSDGILQSLRKIRQKFVIRGEADTREETKEAVRPDGGQVSTEYICSPAAGTVLSLDDVPDEVFSEHMMGEGVAVIPTGEGVYAPEDGTVHFVFETHHAVGFRTESGIDLLIHMGIDTVALKGEGFSCFVSSGQRVKKGTLMLKLNLDYIREHALSLASPIICTDLKENQTIRRIAESEVQAGEVLFAVETKTLSD